MLDKQPAGVLRRRIAAVPAQRGLAGRLLDQLDGGGNLPTLLGLRQPGVIGPAIAVTADVPIAGGDRRRGRRVGLEGAGAAEDRHRDLQPAASRRACMSL